jgi:putative FmdB family regulatory protein
VPVCTPAGYGTPLGQVFGSAGTRIYDRAEMPIYEFECEKCGARFEELVAVGAAAAACPECGSSITRRLLSAVSPPGRQPRGAAVRSDESRRGEREAARGERLAETKRKRAAGEVPPPRTRGGSDSKGGSK